MDTVQVLLWNIRAERDSNWAMHVSTQAAMLPVMFAANRVNYSRYTPVYLLEMLNLPEDVQQAFDEGHFTYREKPGAFNGLWSDMGVEKTVIRDSKSNGGVIGLTRKPSALLRWSVTRHLMGQYASVIRERSGNLNGAESKGHSIKRDEDDVTAMHNHLVNNMTNPFDVEKLSADVLINISTGVHASKEITNSLLNVSINGKQQLDNFVSGVLSTEGKKSFYSPIPRSKLQTFSDLAKKTSFRTGSKETRLLHISPELVFRRALCLAECREDITVENVLSYPIGAVPISLFHEDESMRKTNKADLTHKLESEIEKVDIIPPYEKNLTIFIRDALAIVQSMKPAKGSTFDELSSK